MPPMREEPLKLPPGYRLDESDPDLVILRREDGTEAACFMAESADPEWIERAAWEDHGSR